MSDVTIVFGIAVAIVLIASLFTFFQYSKRKRQEKRDEVEEYLHKLKIDRIKSDLDSKNRNSYLNQLRPSHGADQSSRRAAPLSSPNNDQHHLNYGMMMGYNMGSANNSHSQSDQSPDCASRASSNDTHQHSNSSHTQNDYGSGSSWGSSSSSDYGSSSSSSDSSSSCSSSNDY